MKAFKCDRCGKFFTSPDGVSQNAVNVNDSSDRERNILIDDWHNGIDLCMDCSMDLKTWWEAGQAVKEEE